MEPFPNPTYELTEIERRKIHINLAALQRMIDDEDRRAFDTYRDNLAEFIEYRNMLLAR